MIKKRIRMDIIRYLKSLFISNTQNHLIARILIISKNLKSFAWPNIQIIIRIIK